jgi:hypothetical protein
MTDIFLDTPWHAQPLVARLDFQLSARFGHVTTLAKLGNADATSRSRSALGNPGGEKKGVWQRLVWVNRFNLDVVWQSRLPDGPGACGPYVAKD